MGFFDKVKETASSFGESVSKAASETADNAKKLAEKQRLKKEMSAIEANIQKQYAEIGKRYAEEHANAEDDPFAAEISAIAGYQTELTNKRQEIAALDGNTTCAACGAAISTTAQFCDKCGAKCEKPEPVVAEVCGCIHCGAALEEGAVFCPECGTRVDDAARAAQDAAAEAEKLAEENADQPEA